MPRAFLITNKRYDSTQSILEDQQHHQLHHQQQSHHHSHHRINLHSRENSPERSVCTAEVPSNNNFYAITSDNETSVLFKPSSPGSPAHLFNRISVLANTGATVRNNAALLKVITCNPPVNESKALNVSEYSPIQNESIDFEEDSEDQAQDLSLHHLRTNFNSEVKEENANNTYNDVSSESYSQNQSEYLSLSNDIHICPDCGKRYSTSSNLARHRQTHRSVTDKKARKCPHCDKVYVSMPAYSMHVRTHSQGCQCPYCGKCFSRPWLLQGHIRTHTGEKPFKCPICSKAFADKSNLRAHVQTHSTTKPYVCQRCGKAFALKSYLYKHEESSCMRMHRHSGHGQQRSVLSLFDDSSRSTII